MKFFSGVKFENLIEKKKKKKKKKKYIYFARNIDFGYMLELPWQGGFNEYPQSMLWIKITNTVYPCEPQFYYKHVILNDTSMMRTSLISVNKNSYLAVMQMN